MMAAGLPVVDLYRENNLYDIPSEGVLLAETTPEAIATALIEIIDSPKLQDKMSKAGINFMKNYPLERGYNDFLLAVNQVLNGEKVINTNVEKIYNNQPVQASQEVMDVNYIIKPVPVACAHTGKKIRFLVRCKKFIIRKLHRQL